MDQAASYLDDPAFSEAHTGPVLVDDLGVPHDRDPSPEQIRRMAEAIRRVAPRDPVGLRREPLAMPMVAEDTFHVRSVDRF